MVSHLRGGGEREVKLCWVDGHDGDPGKERPQTVSLTVRLCV